MVSPSPELYEQIKKEMKQIQSTLENILTPNIAFDFKATPDKPEGFPHYVEFRRDENEVARLYYNSQPISLVVLDESFRPYAQQIQHQLRCNVSYNLQHS
ncbi:MAG: hypothetical protein Q8R37_05175 [Nanoarchaeota archaeon]|nr:hypothetical protein [Nanoarchaeota archaeon]